MKSIVPSFEILIKKTRIVSLLLVDDIGFLIYW